MVEVPVKLGSETSAFPHRASAPPQAWGNPERDWRVVVRMEPRQDTVFSLGFQMQRPWWWDLQAAVSVEGWVRFPCQQSQGRRRPLTVKKISAPLILNKTPSREEEEPCAHPPLKALSPTCCSCSTSHRTLDELCSPLPAPTLKPV